MTWSFRSLRIKRENLTIFFFFYSSLFNPTFVAKWMHQNRRKKKQKLKLAIWVSIDETLPVYYKGAAVRLSGGSSALPLEAWRTSVALAGYFTCTVVVVYAACVCIWRAFLYMHRVCPCWQPCDECRERLSRAALKNYRRGQEQKKPQKKPLIMSVVKLTSMDFAWQMSPEWLWQEFSRTPRHMAACHEP